MTQDKVVYEITVFESDRIFVQDVINKYDEMDEFEATIVDESNGGIGEIVFEVEVHGDSYAIPEIENELVEMTDNVNITCENVEIGGSKFR